MKEGEQGNFLDIIDSDPVMVANVALYERMAMAKKAREKRAGRIERKQINRDRRDEFISGRATGRLMRQRMAQSSIKRNVKQDLEMRVFRLDSEITDMKVELAGLISQARARMVIMQDLEWQNC